MTAVGIIGAGSAATLHAEAVRASDQLQLAGVSSASTHSPRAALLAGALDCPAMSTSELASVCDVVVVATPPAQRAGVLATVAGSRRVTAALVESPAATTVEDVMRLDSAFQGRPILVGVNLLHAPAVRQVLQAIANMDPHHLQLRLSVPKPDRGPHGADQFGGGVLMDPTAGFWPIVVAALGAVRAVEVPRLQVVDGRDERGEVVLHGVSGRRASATLTWGASVAEASLEAADAEHVARVDVWPAPVAEIDASALETFATAAPGGEVNLLAELGFVAQLERLARLGRGEAEPWPDLSVGAVAVMIATAAAQSARLDGAVVEVADAPYDTSPAAILSR